jgi:DNA-binding CsgD family transcriptional regulator
MNQHVVFRTGPGASTPRSDEPLKALRRIAALAGCHHAMLHRLAPAGTPLKVLALIHNWRDPALLSLKAADIIPPEAAARLAAGEPVVAWMAEGALCERTRRTLARAQINAFVSLPFHNACGANLALTVCDAAVSLNAQRLEHLRLAASDFAAAQWARLKSAETGAAAISAREAACLQWAAAGKTSEDCAQILGLSPHTVNQHLASAAVKLGAVNRVQAVAKAVRAGLINLAEI